MEDDPDPLQMYGRQKREGELAVLKEKEKGAKVTILRVPLLYAQPFFPSQSPRSKSLTKRAQIWSSDL